MPRFLPFAGLRYSRSHVAALDDVVCPPYDVISESERSALEARSPYNIVRLELPHDETDGDRYRGAAILLDAWRDGGVLHRDGTPRFYGYRMRFTDPGGSARQTVGVIGALGLEVPGSGVLPHEETTPKAKTDRLDLLRATRSNLSPIWGLSPGSGLSQSCRPPAHPADHATDDDRVIHELWPITDRDQVAAVTNAVGSQPVLIADGHHRYETALAYRDERAAAGVAGEDDDFVMALVVELAEEQLTVQAIHRLLLGLPAGFDLLAALEPWFDVTPTGPADRTIADRMADAGAMAVLTRSGAWLARPRPVLHDATTHDLDSSRLDVALAQLPPHQLLFQHGWDRCRRRGGDRPGRRRRPAAAGDRRPDRRHQPGRGADAAQDHVLLAQAPHRDGGSGAGRLKVKGPDVPGRAMGRRRENSDLLRQFLSTEAVRCCRLWTHLSAWYLLCPADAGAAVTALWRRPCCVMAAGRRHRR